MSIERFGISAPKGTVFNATAPGTMCYQGNPYWTQQFTVLANVSGGDDTEVDLVQSEDCLHLDVIVPSKPVNSSLPVIVMIHGGGKEDLSLSMCRSTTVHEMICNILIGYVAGSSFSVDGKQFVSAAEGRVIWVQIQYRLGAFGFLGSKTLLKDGVANAGLLDQRAALEWVQRNIAAFGGDPTRVTIWGGSAGGGSVTSQMMLHGGGRPPFHAAIAESPWWQQLHDDEVLEAQFKQLLKASGCRTLACLRRLSANQLASASELVYELGWADGTYGFGDYYFGPYVDGEIIQGLPSLEFAKKRFSKVPLLVNHDAQEGMWLFFFLPQRMCLCVCLPKVNI